MGCAIPHESHDDTYGEQQGIGNETMMDMPKPSMAISTNGLKVTIGTPYMEVVNNNDDVDSSSNTPSVNIYEYRLRKWMKVGEIYYQYKHDTTGQSVSMDSSGTIIAVGSPYLDSKMVMMMNSTNTSKISTEEKLFSPGVVRIYRINTTSSSTISSSSSSSSVFVIGSNSNTNGTTTTNSGNHYYQMGNDIIGMNIGDQFGHSIDLSNDGTTVAIAAKNGCYYQIYQYDDSLSDWIISGETIPCVHDETRSIYNTANDSHSMMIPNVHIKLSGDGSTVMIGDSNVINNTNINRMTGKYYTYEYDDTNEPRWIVKGGNIPETSRTEREYDFGSSIAISDTGNVVVSCGSSTSSSETILSSIPGIDDSLGFCRVYVYDILSYGWTQLCDDVIPTDVISGNIDYNASYITSVSIDLHGKTIAIASLVHSSFGIIPYVSIVQYNASNLRWDPIGYEIVSGSDGGDMKLEVSLSSDGNRLALLNPNHMLAETDPVIGSVLIYELGSSVYGGDFKLSVDFYTYNYLGGINWYIDRLDIEDDGTMRISPVSMLSGVGDNNQRSQTSEFLLSSGGVYRCAIDSWYRAYAEIDVNQQLIAIGLQNETDSDQYTFIAGDNGQIKPQTSTSASIVRITLVIDFDDNPQDIHWVLVSTIPRSRSDITTSMIVNNVGNYQNDSNDDTIRTIVGFGPEKVYSTDLRRKQYIEIIDVSMVPSNSKFTFILTDDGWSML